MPVTAAPETSSGAAPAATADEIDSALVDLNTIRMPKGVIEVGGKLFAYEHYFGPEWIEMIVSSDKRCEGCAD